MPLKFWNDVVLQLKQLNPKASVCITGGEALLFGGLWGLAEKIRENGLGLSLITNGTLSRPEDAPTSSRYSKISKLVSIRLMKI